MHCAVLLVLLLSFLHSASAAPAIIVDYGADGSDGNCNVPNRCNLRAALAAVPDNGIIILKVDNNLTDPLSINTSVTIISDPPSSQRTIAGMTGLFILVSAPKTNVVNVTFTRFGNFNSNGGALIIASGSTFEGFGLSFLNNIAFSGFAAVQSKIQGGAVYNEGTFLCSQCIFKNNRANSHSEGAPNGIAIALGGAIAGPGTVVLRNSTFQQNVASATGSGAPNSTALAFGGAIYGPSLLVVDNCTFWTNSAVARYEKTAVVAANGGAISSANATAITDSFFVDNYVESTSPQSATGNTIFTKNGQYLYINNTSLEVESPPSDSVVAISANKTLLILLDVHFTTPSGPVIVANGDAPVSAIVVNSTFTQLLGSAFQCGDQWSGEFHCINSKCVNDPIGFSCICNPGTKRVNATACA